MSTPVELDYFPQEKIDAILNGILQKHSSFRDWDWQLTYERGDNSATAFKRVVASLKTRGLQLIMSVGPVPFWHKHKLAIYLGVQEFLLEKGAAERLASVKALDNWVDGIIEYLKASGKDGAIWIGHFDYTVREEEQLQKEKVEELIALLK
jgi:hypothetical protein